MRAALLVLALVLVPACAEPLPIRMSDGLAELPDEVEDACHFWGIECALSDRIYGAVMVSLVEVAGDAEDLGQNWGADSCRPGLWVDPSAHHRLEHELGHILVGPEHSEDPANAMFHSGAEDAEVTDDQLDAAEKSADRIVRCR